MREPSRVERGSPIVGAAAAAAAAVLHELSDIEAFAVVLSASMSFVMRRPERELVAVFSSVAARSLAGREAFWSVSSAAPGHL